MHNYPLYFEPLVTPAVDFCLFGHVNVMESISKIAIIIKKKKKERVTDKKVKQW